MTVYELPWELLQKEVDIYGKTSARIWCDRRQHLLIYSLPANRNANHSSSTSSLNSINGSHATNSHTVSTRNILTVRKYSL